MLKQYITEPADVAAIRNGEAEINGKSLLPVDHIRLATKRIYRALSGNPNLAVTAKGLSIKDVTNEWRRISLAEMKALILEHFILVKEQVGNGARSRYEVLTDFPNNFWVPTILQNRWLDTEAQSWFRRPQQPLGKVITRP
jgi:hypothetical protein